jgi:hypothetical protein
MTPDLICATILLILYLGTHWLIDINWDEYRKANSGEETKGNQVNSREFRNYQECPIAFLEKLNLREYQKDAIRSVANKGNTVNSWARRAGKDTTIAASAIHSAIFHPYSTIVIYVQAMHVIPYIKDAINKVLIDLLIPDVSIVNKNNAIHINNSKIIIKSINSKPESSSADIIFFNECNDDELIQERIDLEKHEDSTFHVFGTYPIVLDEQYYAKYTKISWKDFLSIKEARQTKTQLGEDFFTREYD